MPDIRTLQEAVHATAVEKGWWPEREQRSIPEQLALIHSEVSEALEAYRKAPDDELLSRLGEELADVVIRVMDMAGGLGIDLEAAVVAKMAANRTRPHRHGGRRC